MSVPKRLIKKISQIPISFIGFLVKEWKVLITRKKYLYLAIALPLLLGIIYIFTLNSGFNNITMGVCDFDNTQITKDAISSMNGYSIEKMNGENCSTIIEEKVRTGEYLFGIIIPENFTDHLNNLQQTRIVVLYDNTDPSTSSLVEWKIDSSLAPFQDEIVRVFANEIKTQSSQVKDSTDGLIDSLDSVLIPKSIQTKAFKAQEDINKLSNLDPFFVSNPIYVHKKEVFETYNILTLGLAPLFVILNLFLILMLTSTGVINDKKIKLFSRIRASNSSSSIYILSKLVFFFFVSLAQFVIIYLLFLAFGSSFTINFIQLIVATLLISLINTLIGFLIGLVSDNEGVALLVSLVITLPAMFLSGMFFPIKLLPKGLQLFANILPVQLEITTLKEVVLFGTSIEPKLFLIPLVLFILTIYFMNKN